MASEKTYSPNDQQKSFFKIIAGQNASENDLSRFFRACFLNSPEFAQIMLTTIWREAGLSGSAPKADGWECDYQPATPVHGGGRPDLCLMPSLGLGKRAIHRAIYLESKVGAPLTERQLQRYKKHGTEVLVAITKNWPEVSQAWLKRNRVKSLRWQDICRALRQTKCHGQQNRFLCDRFATYLEESDMAYREGISQSDLSDVRSLLVQIASSVSDGSRVPHASFKVADACFELLQDVKHLVREKRPKSKFIEWKSWGPGYFHYLDEDNSITDHAFGFIFYPRIWHDQNFRCTIVFPVSTRKPYLLLHRDGEGVMFRERYLTIRSVLFKRNLDAEKVANAVVKAASDWRVP
jgi:hypothetical protein